MRPSLVLLALVTLLACSGGTAVPDGPSGPSGSKPTGTYGPYGELWNTKLAATSAAIQDSVAVTLTISNPTSATLRLVYGAPFTYARFMQNDTTFTTVVPQLQTDTIMLAANADTILAPIMVHLTVQPLIPNPNGEVIGVPAGTYNVSACAFVPENTSAFMPACASAVQFTVTQ
jgi:hypothetical protein